LSPEVLARVHARMGADYRPPGDYSPAWVAREQRNKRARDRTRERKIEWGKDVLFVQLDQAVKRCRGTGKLVGDVYFVLCQDLLKIGFSIDVDGRLAGMRTDNPFPLQLLGVIAGPVQLEKALHAVFNEHRHQGEWFKYGDAVGLAVKRGLIRHGVKKARGCRPSTTHQTPG